MTPSFIIQNEENQRQTENPGRSQWEKKEKWKPHLKGRRIRIIADLFPEIMQARRKWSGVLKERTQTPN